LFEEKDTVSIHRGLAVLFLSNAGTTGFRDRTSLVEVAEFTNRCACRSHDERAKPAAVATANGLQCAGRVRDVLQFLVKNGALQSGQLFGRRRQILAGF